MLLIVLTFGCDRKFSLYLGELFVDGKVVQRHPERQRLIDAGTQWSNDRPRYSDRCRYAHQRENQGKTQQSYCWVVFLEINWANNNNYCWCRSMRTIILSEGFNMNSSKKFIHTKKILHTVDVIGFQQIGSIGLWKIHLSIGVSLYSHRPLDLMFVPFRGWTLYYFMSFGSLLLHFHIWRTL